MIILNSTFLTMLDNEKNAIMKKHTIGLDLNILRKWNEGKLGHRFRDKSECVPGKSLLQQERSLQ